MKYLLRRILYAFPILIGVNFITFALFFMVNTPDDMARAQLGQKYVSTAMIQQWKEEHGYNQPVFLNQQAEGVHKLTDTLFYNKSLKLFSLQFGFSDHNRNILHDIETRMWPSFAIALPTLILGVLINISLALILILFRGSYLDTVGIILCVVLMSVSGLFYIIGGQYFFAKVLRWFPISGYRPGLEAWHFILLPVLIGVVSGIGAATRWYRVLFLEEVNKDYVRTARAKGLSEITILFKHVLPNAMIPILTGIVVIIPSLFMGSLILEAFFGIPGLGSYTIDAISQQDFAIVRAMVFLGTVLYILGLILTDLTYMMVDPRIRLS